VELAGDGTEMGSEPRLDVHVDVFESGVEGERSVCDLSSDLIEPGDELLRLGVGYQACAAEHASLGLRAADIVTCEDFVEMDRGGEALDGRIRGLTEATTPRFPALACSTTFFSGFRAHSALLSRFRGSRTRLRRAHGRNIRNRRQEIVSRGTTMGSRVPWNTFNPRQTDSQISGVMAVDCLTALGQASSRGAMVLRRGVESWGEPIDG